MYIRIIPRVEDWVRSSNRKVDSYIAPILTGHGSFKSYTKRISKSANEVVRTVECGKTNQPKEMMQITKERQPIPGCNVNGSFVVAMEMAYSISNP